MSALPATFGLIIPMAFAHGGRAAESGGSHNLINDFLNFFIRKLGGQIDFERLNFR